MNFPPPIAIVGMSCRFAGVHSPAALWDVMMSQRNMLTAPGPDVEMPKSHVSLFKAPYPSVIAQLGELYACVQSMQHFPRQVNAGENQDLYFATQLVLDALLDAGIKPQTNEPVRGCVRIGYAPPFNAATVNWLQHTEFLDQTLEVIRRFFPRANDTQLNSVREQLVYSLPVSEAASFLMGTGYRFASWIARECGFGGSACVMDAGMLTGAATLAAAADELISGRSDVALAGALTPPLNLAYLEGLSGEVPFSIRRELHPFAQEQDGTLPGEGGAFFVLKRRADALRDHDRIYALLRAVAVGHNPDNDPSAILTEALSRAEADPQTVGLIEADGTGIAEAEKREIDAIQHIWGEHKPGRPLVGVGSIKGNIGHTLRASMAAGLAKTTLALFNRVLPPQINVLHPNSALASIESSAYLLTSGRPWITGNSSSPRRAVVMGANFDSVRPVGSSAAMGRAAALVLEEEREVAP